MKGIYIYIFLTPNVHLYIVLILLNQWLQQDDVFEKGQQYY